MMQHELKPIACSTDIVERVDEARKTWNRSYFIPTTTQVEEEPLCILASKARAYIRLEKLVEDFLEHEKGRPDRPVESQPYMIRVSSMREALGDLRDIAHLIEGTTISE